MERVAFGADQLSASDLNLSLTSGHAEAVTVPKRFHFTSHGRPPTVELDSEAHAAYVRFSTRKVAKTRPITTDGCIVTVDYGTDGGVIGIELVGVDEFGIVPLLKKAGVQSLPKAMVDRARYVPANLVAA